MSGERRSRGDRNRLRTGLERALVARHPAKILAFDFMTVTVQESEASFIPRDEIQAIRVLANNDPTIA